MTHLRWSIAGATSCPLYNQLSHSAKILQKHFFYVLLYAHSELGYVLFQCSQETFTLQLHYVSAFSGNGRHLCF